MRLIIREALRHGGDGWQEYDRSFRSQAAIDPTIRWNTLLPDLQAATILGQRVGGGTHCSLCRCVDHTSSQCALVFMQQPLSRIQSTGTTLTQGTSRHPPDTCACVAMLASPICVSWNHGACFYPGNVHIQAYVCILPVVTLCGMHQWTPHTNMTLECQRHQLMLLLGDSLHSAVTVVLANAVDLADCLSPLFVHCCILMHAVCVYICHHSFTMYLLIPDPHLVHMC